MTMTAAEFVRRQRSGPQTIKGPDRPPGPSIPQPFPQVRGLTAAEFVQGVVKAGPVKPPPGLKELAVSMGQGFNVGLASLPAGLVDLTNLGLSFIDAGIGTTRATQEPIGGSINMQRGLAALNLAPELGEDADVPFFFRSARTVGSAASMFLPFAFAIKANALRGQFGKLTPLANMYRTSPAGFAAFELASAKTAGLSGTVAYELFDGDPTAVLLSEVAGGVTPYFLQHLGAAGVGRLRTTLLPFAPRSIEARARARIVEAATDEEDIVASLSEQMSTMEKALTPGQRTQDPGLLSLERTTLDASAELTGDFRGMVTALGRAQEAEMRAATGGGVRPESTQEFVQARVEFMNELLERRLAAAVLRARARVGDAGPNVTREEANKIAREELTTVYKEADANQQAGYSAIARKEKVSNEPVLDEWRLILSERSRGSDPDDIPKFLHERMSGTSAARLRREETVGTLLDFRSSLLRLIREEASKGGASNGRTINMLDRMAKAVIGDPETGLVGAIGAAKDKHGIGEALDISHSFYNRFKRGSIAKLFYFDKANAALVPKELTLESTIMRGGLKGAEAMDRMMDMVETNPAILREASEEVIREAYVKQVAPEGIIIPSSAKVFFKKHAELLERFPALQDLFRDANRAQALVTNMTTRNKQTLRSSHNKRKSILALYMDGPPSRGIQRVLDSRNPGKAMEDLVRSVKRDPTGDALRGLKEEFVEQLIARSQLKGFSKGDDLAFSGKAIEEFMFKHGRAASKLYSPEELARIQIIADNARKVELSIAGRRRLDAVLPEPSGFTRTLFRTIYTISAARLGAWFGKGSPGGSLQIAGKSVGEAKRLLDITPAMKVEALIGRAVLDQDLMRLILTKYSSMEQEAKLLTRLSAWTADLMHRDLSDPQEQPQQQAQGIQ